jgi:hypothetical protein
VCLAPPGNVLPHDLERRSAFRTKSVSLWPGVVVADRWGEIVHVATTSQVDILTSPEDLLDWLDYLEKRCPECEGEAK